MGTSADINLPADYASLLTDIKARITSVRVRAALAVNAELVTLYWEIGRNILDRQAQAGWGGKVIDQLSRDLRSAFPGMKGLSRTNLMYMRKLAECYPAREFVPQLVGQTPSVCCRQSASSSR